MNFAIPADDRVKVKESEKREKYLDLARELKELWNMKVTLILILGTNPKELLKRLEDSEKRGKVETIQTATLVRSARILRRVLET